MIDIDWVEGAPDELRAGMIVQWIGGVLLVGHVDEGMCLDCAPENIYQAGLSKIQRWAWLVKPHELEWIEAIGARKP